MEEIIYFVILLCFSIYLLVNAYYIYQKAKDLLEKGNENDLKKEFKNLLGKAIPVLQNYGNFIGHPYFFSYPIQYILYRLPRFIHVLQLSKFMIDNSISQKDLNDLLKEQYGLRYEHVLDLNILIKINLPYGIRSYYHYIINDINKSILLYLQNKAYLQKLYYIK